MATNVQWEAYENCWPTDIGKFIPGQTAIFRGHDIFEEFEDSPWVDMYLYAVTGRRFSAGQVKFFEAIWKLGMSYPDPCIWNNRIAAMGGSYRSSATLSLMAAMSASEAKLFGRYPEVRSADFFQRAKTAGFPDVTAFVDQELEMNGRIYGFGRPIAQTDERVAPVTKVAARYGLCGAARDYATEVENYLLKLDRPMPGNWKLYMNGSGVAGALAIDQGMSPDEFYRFMVPGFLNGAGACYVDALSKPAGALFPVACDKIRYSGPAPRSWD